MTFVDILEAFLLSGPLPTTISLLVLLDQFLPRLNFRLELTGFDPRRHLRSQSYTNRTYLLPVYYLQCLLYSTYTFLRYTILLLTNLTTKTQTGKEARASLELEGYEDLDIALVTLFCYFSLSTFLHSSPTLSNRVGMYYPWWSVPMSLIYLICITILRFSVNPSYSLVLDALSGILLIDTGS